MPGDGTKLAITTNKSPPPARLLDLTRLVSRAGKGLTGIDRVERAYLERFVELQDPVFGLARTSLGYVLLDRTGMRALLDRVDGREPWGPADRLSRVSRRLDPMLRRAQSDLRRLCLARRPRHRVKRLFTDHLPEGTAYFNVGHSNVSDRVLSALHHGVQARIVVLLHDTIPLDLPGMQRPGTVARFRAMLRRVRYFADLVICNSEATRHDVLRHMARWGPAPETAVVHLGHTRAEPRWEDLPPGLPPTSPYFLCIGTIEPRKNHAFLLDVWKDMAARPADGPLPTLVICGRRGWQNDALFARLDDSCAATSGVIELNELGDGALAALLAGAAGVLFPSVREGFGLPALEAAAAGVPLVCNDLPAFREFLADIPVYAPVSDRYLWITIIRDLAQPDRAEALSAETITDFDLPTWETHFNAILTMA